MSLTCARWRTTRLCGIPHWHPPVILFTIHYEFEGSPRFLFLEHLGQPSAAKSFSEADGGQGSGGRNEDYQYHRQTSGARVRRVGGARPECGSEGRTLTGCERPPH